MDLSLRFRHHVHVFPVQAVQLNPQEAIYDEAGYSSKISVVLVSRTRIGGMITCKILVAM